MAAFNEQINKEMEAWERIKQQKRIDSRNERLEKEKEDNHRIFLSGQLVEKYIPAVKSIQVFKGKNSKIKNSASFAPLEKVLTILADNEELMTQLEVEIKQQFLAERKE